MTTLTLLASGTRGDIQPYIALARGLDIAGYHARIATHPVFAPLLAAYDVAWTPLDPNPNDLFATYPSALTFDGDLRRSLDHSWRYLRAVQPRFERLLESAWRAAHGADALIVGLATSWGQHIADALGVPCVWAPLQPLSRTRRFASVFQPWHGSLGGRYNHLTHRVLEQVLWQPWRASITRWRRAHGLPRLPASGPWDRIYRDGTPFVYGISPRVLDRPDDWPATHALSGFWFLDHPDGWRSSRELESFLACGSPPIAIGWGSMGAGRARRLLPPILTSLRRAGVRAVLLIDRREHGALPDGVLAIDDAPHDWLLPRMAAVIHHGGAGTTAAGLRAGVPALAIPFGVDQLFWGRRIAALGAGVDPLPASRLTAESFSHALDRLVADQHLRRHADLVGQQIRAENGVGQAVALLRQHVGSP